jgi:hypothetical protein
MAQTNWNQRFLASTYAFATVVLEHPEVCRLDESLLTELVDVPLQEQCERTGPVPCRFVVPV